MFSFFVVVVIFSLLIIFLRRELKEEETIEYDTPLSEEEAKPIREVLKLRGKVGTTWILHPDGTKEVINPYE